MHEGVMAAEQYLAQVDRVLAAGGQGWESLERWWGTAQLSSTMSDRFRSLEDLGMRTEGRTVFTVLASEVLVDPSPGGQDWVRLTLCVDASAQRRYRSEGSLVADHVGAVVNRISLHRRGYALPWVVMSEEPRSEEPC